MRRRTLLGSMLSFAFAMRAEAAPTTTPSPASTGTPEEARLETMSRRQVTGIIEANQKIVSPDGVEELISVPINGASEWLSIRGRDRRNPLLLFIHGGPGSPTMPEAWTFQSPWEDYFTVVQWDQRGAGKTYASNDPAALAKTITGEQMILDAERVIAYLLEKFQKKKLFVLGHSWGSYLGLSVAHRHPEWLYAYIGTGQVVDFAKSEAEGYAFALSEAKARDNSVAVRELLALAPYPGPKGSITTARIFTQRKWLIFYGGLTWGRSNFEYDADAWALSPDYTVNDLRLLDEGTLYSLTHLLNVADQQSFEDWTDFACPLFFFEGAHDYTVSTAVTKQWFERVKAPQKAFVTFRDSAHMVMLEQPGRYLYQLVTLARPIAVKTGDAAPDEAIAVT